MPVTCSSCESTEFTLMDGMHYCNFCGTAIQELGTQREQSEDNVLPATSLSLLDKFNIKSAKAITSTQNESTGKKSQTMEDHGRPWKSDEGYQFIILQQAKALVSLGARTDLPEIVFRIWMQYLTKTNRAFLKEKLSSEEMKRKRLFKDKLRDKFPGTLADPRIKPISYFSSRKTQWYAKRNRMAKMDLEAEADDDDEKKNDDGKKNDDDDDDDEVEGNENKDEDDETSLDEGTEKDKYYGSRKHVKMLDSEEKLLVKSINQEVEDKKELNALKHVDVTYDEDGRPIFKKGFRGHIKGVELMCMLKTLAFVYLGLHITNPDVLICDLLRWVHEGLVPYKSFPNWPQDMKFSNHEFKYYVSERVPSSDELYVEVNRLVYYLDLNCFQPVDVITASARFVMELGLPSETNSMLVNLINQTKPHIKLRRMTLMVYSIDPATIVMAYLLFLLKMLFGLDDHSEWVLSDYVTYLSDNIHFDKPLFSWREWMIYCEKKYHQDNMVHEVHNMSNMMYIRNANEALGKYRSLLQNSNRETKGRTTNWMKKRLVSLKKHHDLFSSLKKKINQSTKAVNYDNDDDNIDDQDYDYDLINNNLINGDERDNNNNNESVIHYNHLVRKKFKKSPFHRCTYSYLVNSKKFLDSIVNHKSDTEKEKTLNESSIDLFEDLLSQSSKEDNQCLKCKSLDPGKTLDDIITEIPNKLKVVPKPWTHYLVFPLPELSYNTVIDKFNFNFTTNEIKDGDHLKNKPQSSFHCKKPHTYHWLLNLCSKHIFTSVSYLENYLKKLENLLLDEIKGKQFERLHMRARLYRLCFSDRKRTTRKIRSTRQRNFKRRKTDIDDDAQDMCKDSKNDKNNETDNDNNSSDNDNDDDSDDVDVNDSDGSENENKNCK